MPFKNIFIFTSGDQSSLGNFGTGYYEEHFCETILTLDQWQCSHSCRIARDSLGNCKNHAHFPGQ